MPSYRIYEIASTGHIEKTPTIIVCDDDQAATELAKRFLDGRVIEIWEQQRKVAQLAPVYAQPDQTPSQDAT